MTSSTNVETKAPSFTYDEGLRHYMISVYNYMISGVLITGVTALLFAGSGYAELMFGAKGPNLLGWMLVLAPLPYVFILNSRLKSGSADAGRFLFWGFAGVIGLSLSTVFLSYTGASIATTFFAAAAAFAGLSLYGYTTRRNLGPMGTFLVAGLWGLIAAQLINLVAGSAAMSYVLSSIGILIFAGLTAYDTQKIRNAYRSDISNDMAERLAIFGAIELYLDFLNLFMHLLRFMGVRKD